MKELFPKLYREEIRLPEKGSTPLNLYLVKGEGRSLLIDTGVPSSYCLERLTNFLDEAGVSVTDLDVFITHNHSDHSGQAEELAEQGARIYMNPAEVRHKQDLLHCYLAGQGEQKRILRTIGITPQLTPGLYSTFLESAQESYGVRRDSPDFPFEAIEPGELLSYGDYRFQVISLRGHTYGQLGLYDKGRRILFCADQIMTRIAPVVGSMYQDLSLLECYMGSMEIIKHTYGDCALLPGHFEMITDVGKEVDRIVISYLDKCDLMKRILERQPGPMTIRQIGMMAYGRRTENVKTDLLNFTLIMAKTFSCMEYLYEEGFVERLEQDGVLYWQTRLQTV